MPRQILYASSSLLFAFLTIHAAAVDQIVVRNVVLEGVKNLPAAEQQRIIRNVRQHVHNKSDIGEVGERVRFGFQRDGFFHVFVQDPTVKVVQRNEDQETVDLVMDVQEGEQYRLKEIRFGGSNEFPAAMLRAQFPIADGDIFNREKIGQGLDALRKCYDSKGFKNFAAVPQTVEDKAKRTIVLLVDMDAGAASKSGN